VAERCVREGAALGRCGDASYRENQGGEIDRPDGGEEQPAPRQDADCFEAPNSTDKQRC
jgi:hypothetical protein